MEVEGGDWIGSAVDASHFVVVADQGTPPVAFETQVSVNSMPHASPGSASARSYSGNTISYASRDNSHMRANPRLFV